MNLYLDDIRNPPAGWVLVKTAPATIAILMTGQVKNLSLDHDLGDDDNGTGYDVLKWIELKVRTDPKFVLPNILIHTANPVGRMNMEAAIKAIHKWINNRA